MIQKQIILLLAVMSIVSCFNQTDEKNVSEATISTSESAPNNNVDTQRESEYQSTIPNDEALGQLVFRIQFDIKTNNLEDYENGKIPWIRIDSPDVEIKNLIGKDEVVIPEKKLSIIIDYPLETPCIFELVSKTGFTRSQLVSEISRKYYQLYDEEERTATIKTIPVKDRKIHNRNQTNGKYGIWGHDIGDLVLDEIAVYKKANGEVTLILVLES